MNLVKLAIKETLDQYFAFGTTAKDLTAEILEFGFENFAILEFNIYDALADYMPEQKARAIARECILNVELALKEKSLSRTAIAA